MIPEQKKIFNFRKKSGCFFMKPRKWGKIEKMIKKLTVSKILCMAGSFSLVESYAAGFLSLLGDCGGCFF
jgi:hypothetical protein